MAATSGQADGAIDQHQLGDRAPQVGDALDRTILGMAANRAGTPKSLGSAPGDEIPLAAIRGVLDSAAAGTVECRG